ncbi:MAG TPA: class I SAM-dependent methyltransferase [Lacibacter sp.]|nr:class I SAM-dependent methyltransferase [Lacibacter sp.]
MSSLYENLAGVYDIMYQSFNNYDDEYKFYSSIFHHYNKRRIVEIGCGTGNLAQRFIENHYHYVGVDLSSDMLQFAQFKNKDGLFLKADMRRFTLSQPAEACLMAGRTISYLQSDEDVYACFSSVFKQLQNDGIFCFDFIDAFRFIPTINDGKEIIHQASFENRNYKRSSFWKVNYKSCFTFSWRAMYYELKKDNNEEFLGKDDSVIRAFTKDDITLFLKLCGFHVLQIIDKPSYAFDTYAVVAQKS